jgi:hypothetical protein
MMVRALSILSAIGLAACASIPLKTVYNLWNFDPWTSDYRVWRAAVRLPEGRGVDLATAQVTMKVETWREGDAARAAEVFVLERSSDLADTIPLAAERRPGFALAAFRFAPADHARMEALRARILAAKKAGLRQRGSVSISARACGKTPEPVTGGFPLSTFLMVDAKDGYNPLLVDYDLGPELRKAAAADGGENLCRVGG